MSKNIKYQGKMLSEVFSKLEILATILMYFRQIDDKDFQIFESIIRRKLGLSVGVPAIEKPLCESIEDLSGLVEVSSVYVDGVKTSNNMYRIPVSITMGQNILDLVPGLVPFINKELREIISEMHDDSIELTVRRILIDSKEKNLHSGYQNFDVENAVDLDILEENIVDGEASYSLTEGGRIYLLSKDYEDQINEMIALIYGQGCHGKYFREYLEYIYSQEMLGVSSFVSKLRAIDYLMYCKRMGYDDGIMSQNGDSKDHGIKAYPKPAITDDKK